MPWETREKSLSAISEATGQSIASWAEIENSSNFVTIRFYGETGKSNDYKFTQVFPSQADNKWAGRGSK